MVRCLSLWFERPGIVVIWDIPSPHLVLLYHSTILEGKPFSLGSRRTTVNPTTPNHTILVHSVPVAGA